MIKKKVYLDYAASTPVNPKVAAAMLPYFSEKYGNPGAIHAYGQEAQAAIDSSRQKIAEFFGCDFNEIIFTGSATESNNLAIRGIIKAWTDNTPSLSEARPASAPRGLGLRSGLRPTMPASASKPVRGCHPSSHVITSAIEHKSVLETCHDLEKEGVEVSYIKVSKDGFVNPEDVKAAIKENTVLVSIMYVNNEIGTIQPIQEIAKAIRSYKLKAISHKLPMFHTDAAQALNYLDCKIENLGVDMLTFSGQKIYGPKGIGGLYIKKDVSISPIITGGNQERGLRSGTENVPYIVGLSKAIDITETIREVEASRIKELRDYFIDKILEKIPNAELNGSRENRIANNANFLFRGISANNLLIALDQEGVAASAGSTCTIKTVTPSEVLMAMGRIKEEARQSIRFTLGRGTTRSDIDYAVSVLEKIMRRF